MVDLLEFLNEAVSRGKRDRITNLMSTEIDGETYPIDGTCNIDDLVGFLEERGFYELARTSEDEIGRLKGKAYKKLKTKYGIRVSIRNSECTVPKVMVVVFDKDGGRIVDLRALRYLPSEFGGRKYSDCRDFSKVVEYIVGTLNGYKWI